MKDNRKFSLIHLTEVHGHMETHQKFFGKTVKKPSGYGRLCKNLPIPQGAPGSTSGQCPGAGMR